MLETCSVSPCQPVIERFLFSPWIWDSLTPTYLPPPERNVWRNKKHRSLTGWQGLIEHVQNFRILSPNNGVNFRVLLKYVVGWDSAWTSLYWKIERFLPPTIRPLAYPYFDAGYRRNFSTYCTEYHGIGDWNRIDLIFRFENEVNVSTYLAQQSIGYRNRIGSIFRFGKATKRFDLQSIGYRIGYRKCIRTVVSSWLFVLLVHIASDYVLVRFPPLGSMRIMLLSAQLLSVSRVASSAISRWNSANSLLDRPLAARNFTM